MITANYVGTPASVAYHQIVHHFLSTNKEIVVAAVRFKVAVTDKQVYNARELLEVLLH